MLLMWTLIHSFSAKDYKNFGKEIYEMELYRPTDVQQSKNRFIPMSEGV
jgi:hypothetical protein